MWSILRFWLFDIETSPQVFHSTTNLKPNLPINTLNNRPHIHLSLVGIYWGPYPLLKGSNRGVKQLGTISRGPQHFPYELTSFSIPALSPIIMEDDESVVPSVSERTVTRSGTAPTAPSTASNVTPVSRQVRDEWSEPPQELWWTVGEAYPKMALNFVSAKSWLVEKIDGNILYIQEIYEYNRSTWYSYIHTYNLPKWVVRLFVA